MRLSQTIVATLIGVAAIATVLAQGAPLPPAPAPSENPITESKRVLGKILFWDEQLSSDDTVACGTCHRPASGGGDPRVGVHPGPDERFRTRDDILASPGVARANEHGVPIEDRLFAFEVQVTSRSAPTTLGAAYAPELFWDGRAASTFFDPETGAQSIAAGGALENQAVGPILSDVEMAYEGRTWNDVRDKLTRSIPLRNATDLPQDIVAALSDAPDYPALFTAAFGDPAITAERIAYAIAGYERTLIPDRTPWDDFVAGDSTALTPPQIQGWVLYQASTCSICHAPPTFTDHTYRNIGLRSPDEDLGRQNVTGLEQDRGRFKVPTLRNVTLKPTAMHNGRVTSVEEAVLWYRANNKDRFTDNLDPLVPLGIPASELPMLVDFITNGLTDPRAAAETFPFDRPTVHDGLLPMLSFATDTATMTWQRLEGVVRYNIYRGDLAELRTTGPDGLPVAGYGACISASDPDPTDTVLIDNDVPGVGEGFFYLKSVIDSTGAERGLGVTSQGVARGVLLSCD